MLRSTSVSYRNCFQQFLIRYSSTLDKKQYIEYRISSFNFIWRYEILKMEKLKAFLLELTPFSDGEFEDWKKYFRVINLRKGEYLFEHGKICKQIAFIKEGSLRSYYLNDKSEEITACFRSEMNVISSYRSFVLKEPSILSVVALEDSQLIVLDYDNLQKLYQESTAWLIIGRILAEREYIHMEEYAGVLNHEKAKEKYLRLLNEQGDLVMKLNVEHVASYLGVTRRTLSRIRQEMS